MDDNNPIGKVLVACDFSAAAERALAWTARLQRRLGDTKVVLLNVWTLPPVLAAAVPLPPSGPTEEDWRGLTRELESLASRHGLEAQVLIEISPDPGGTIVRQAEQNGCDLIVMGTHGRSGVARAVLGSSADWVVRKASCPVVVMRAS